jgi:hypothetical protein
MVINKVELPIIDHYPIIKQFFKSCSSVLHFEWFKTLGERYLELGESYLEMIFEA